MFGSKAASAEKEGETHAKEAEPSREAASQPTEGAPKSRQPSEAEPTSQPKGASGAKKAAAEERVEESKGPVTAFVDVGKAARLIAVVVVCTAEWLGVTPHPRCLTSLSLSLPRTRYSLSMSFLSRTLLVRPWHSFPLVSEDCQDRAH